MRYASLLSGGKDSTLAHHVARERGFEPVAGIVIYPEDPESHMFHVPNLDLARASVDALDLEAIEVQAPDGKETETQALAEAFQAARELGADTVVTGAVASEYQRTRVERAAHETDLKTHNPLWHVDPEAILEELVHGAWEVRFSAVSAWGLDREWLGRRLDEDALEDLRKAHREHGVHVGGEGGEYETLVLDAPAFDRAIEVTDTESTWERDRGFWHVNGWRWAEDA